MYLPEGLEDTPFKWKIFSNFVAFSEYPNFKIWRFGQISVAFSEYMIFTMCFLAVNNV